MGIRWLPTTATPAQAPPLVRSSSGFTPLSKWTRQRSLPAAFKRQDSSAPTIYSDADNENLTVEDGAFCGWVYVAELPHKKHKKKSKAVKKMDFQLRYCRLNEVVCAFFASERDACVGQELSQHVVITVECLPERNKTFVVTDYEDRQLSLHTTMESDFGEWLEAFSSAIRSTQVAKARPPSATRRARNHTLPDHLAERPTESRMRSLTEPPDFMRDTVMVQQTHPRAATVWLYLKNPWWRRKKHSRRYFVLMGRTLSCFSVNKEGQLAQFSVEVLGCRYDHGTDADIFVGAGRTLHVTVKEQRVQDLSSFVERIGVAVAHDPRLPASSTRARSPQRRGGLV